MNCTLIEFYIYTVMQIIIPACRSNGCVKWITEPKNVPKQLEHYETKIHEKS